MQSSNPSGRRISITLCKWISSEREWFTPGRKSVMGWRIWVPITVIFITFMSYRPVMNRVDQYILTVVIVVPTDYQSKNSLDRWKYRMFEKAFKETGRNNQSDLYVPERLRTMWWRSRVCTWEYEVMLGFHLTKKILNLDDEARIWHRRVCYMVKPFQDGITPLKASYCTQRMLGKRNETKWKWP